MEKSNWRCLGRSVILAALLLCAALPGRAQQYVFLYKNGNDVYFLYNNNRAVDRTTTFNASTCVFTGTGTSSSTFYNGDRYLQRNTNTLRFNATASTWVITTYGRVYYNANTDRYIRYNGGWTALSSTNSPGTGLDYTVLFTYSDKDATLSAPVITGADALMATGASNYSVAATAKPQYHQFDGYSGTAETTYYWYNNALQTSAPTETNVTTGTWSLTGGSTYATVNSSNGTITVSSLPPTDLTMTLSCSVTANGTTKTATKTITLYSTNVEAPTITRTVDNVTLATTSAGSTIYYTTDGSTPNSSSTAYSGSFSIGGLSYPITVKAIAIRGGNSSSVASVTYNNPQCAMPVISITQAGAVTISCATEGATIYYTTDGTTPTAGSTAYSGSFNVANLTTVKAIAIKAGCDNSDVASEEYLSSGVGNGKVVLDDREDHTWTYYAGIDASVDGGNYNTNYVGKLYSPNPRNVKITYRGKNDVAGSSTVVRVSISENDSVFIYFKTLEEGVTSGEYPYQVISNPFSVRPSTGTGGSKVYYGFAGWKIISGGEYIKNHNNNDVLSLDEEIVFNNLPYSSVNCTSAEIVFQTSWTTANVQTGNNIATMFGNFSGGTYETNFAVLTGSYTTAWTGNKNATVTSVYPDGSADSRSGVNTQLNLTLNDGYTVKYEYIHINNNSSTFSMGTGTKTLYIGRGVDNTTANGVCCNLIQGYDNSITGGLTYTLKIESGIYNYLSYIKGYDGGRTDNTVTGTVAVKGVLGCDYDRAKNDNTKLKIQQQIMMGYANNTALLRSTTAGQEVLNVTLKSGSLNSNMTSAGTADASQSFYIGIAGQYSAGYRIFTMEGGEMWSLAAGLCQNTATTNSVRFRIKGGLIKGSIYGSAANANSYGYKQMILTGGQVKGWIAGGGNGTSANGGTTTGSSYVYVGGKCRVDSEGSDTKINSSLGGNVFGSGSGVDGSTTWGEMLYGSNVVIADDAYIERNVFGGGNFGWTDQYATIYLTGKEMSVDNVYGGANQNKGDNVKIYMTGGTVRNGLYGGSNTSGTIQYNVEMHVDGGTVGNSETGDGVFGGGYGSSTIVTGNVSLTLGTSTTAADSATVNGNVYGGSAEGRTNSSNTSNTNNTTIVTMNKARINGNLFGGAYGSGARLYGLITVNVNGGLVNGNVFGGGDAAPYSRGGNYPVVNMTGGQATNVFGGGKGGSAIVTGNPQVTLSGNAHVTGNVYGGGDAAEVSGQTNVILQD